MQKISHRETADRRSTRYDGGNNKEHKQTEGLNTQEETGAEGRCLGETAEANFLCNMKCVKLTELPK